eukprot:SM000006S19478  [mRNA]  locus=s6:1052663:1054502:+ [translate_table: standard]
MNNVTIKRDASFGIWVFSLYNVLLKASASPARSPCRQPRQPRIAPATREDGLLIVESIQKDTQHVGKHSKLRDDREDRSDKSRGSSKLALPARLWAFSECARRAIAPPSRGLLAKRSSPRLTDARPLARVPSLPGQMSFPSFVLCIMLGPLALSVLFTGLYLLDLDGLQIPSDDSPAWQGPLVRTTVFKVFVFAFSLATMYGGSPAHPRSPYVLALANLNTLASNLLFVFISGAGASALLGLMASGLTVVAAGVGPVFQRLSQPSSPVQWSKHLLITDDLIGEASARNPGKENRRYKLVVGRLMLLGTGAALIDVKFDLVMRCTKITRNSTFVHTYRLPLVRSEMSQLKYGMVMRHVINEDSPLWNQCSYDDLVQDDTNFTITLSGVERTSMQQIFDSRVYTVYDRDVLWDRQFADIVKIDAKGQYVMYQNRLNLLEPPPNAVDATEDAAGEEDARPGQGNSPPASGLLRQRTVSVKQ